jgi:hypothetical protein
LNPKATNIFSTALAVNMLAVVVLWPGDVSWLMDEPRLIAAAWHANHDRQIAVGGLYGNFGIRYGPLPTQIYQLLLLITHDPLTLVVLRALLCAGVSAFGLLWLARSLELPGWFAAAALVSPYVVAYHRVLWDASFAMPVGVLALAGFADFLRTDRAVSLRTCVLASILAPTIHPQALASAAPILGWLLWRHRAALWRDRRVLGVIAVIVLLFNGFYFGQFAGQLFSRLSGSVQKGYPGGNSHAISALAPLLGGRLLCGADYLEGLSRSAAPSWLHTAAKACALIFYPLAWIGIGVSAVTAWRVVRGSLTLSPRETVTVTVLAGLVIQAVLSGVMRIPAAPQYFFGTFALHVFVAWLAVHALRKWHAGPVLGALYGIGGAVLTLEAAVSIHAHGYERPLWPTLATSVHIARQLNRYADTTALTDFAVYKKSPQALRTLRLLLPSESGEPREQNGRLLITSDAANAARPSDPVLTAFSSDAALPAGSQSIDITPLPKDWVPDPSTW